MDSTGEQRTAYFPLVVCAAVCVKGQGGQETEEVQTYPVQRGSRQPAMWSYLNLNQLIRLKMWFLSLTFQVLDSRMELVPTVQVQTLLSSLEVLSGSDNVNIANSCTSWPLQSSEQECPFLSLVHNKYAQTQHFLFHLLLSRRLPPKWQQLTFQSTRCCHYSYFSN